jgi:hypothetical protein
VTTAGPSEEKNQNMIGKENGKKKGNLIASHELMT